jgi:hypothetical protein
MIETISREALEKHPAWAPYDEEVDRETILAWGVSGEALARELARYEFCGPQPLYPVLRLDPLPAQPHLVIAVSFDAAGGEQLRGYVFAPHAFGVYVGADEFGFNRNLAGLSARAAARLAAALGTDPERLFPLRYASELRAADGSAIAGEISAFW